MDCELPPKLFSTLFELPIPLAIPQTSYFSNSSRIFARHRSVAVTRHSVHRHLYTVPRILVTMYMRAAVSISLG